MTSRPSLLTQDFPPPPYDLRVHVDAPPDDRIYRRAAERIELAGWFHHALRDLVGVAAAVEADNASATDLSIQHVSAAGQNFHVVRIEELRVYFWLSSATRTVWVLHSQSERLFRASSTSGPIIAARRLVPIRAADARRAARAKTHRGERP